MGYLKHSKIVRIIMVIRLWGVLNTMRRLNQTLVYLHKCNTKIKSKMKKIDVVLLL